MAQRKGTGVFLVVLLMATAGNAVGQASPAAGVNAAALLQNYQQLLQLAQLLNNPTVQALLGQAGGSGNNALAALQALNSSSALLGSLDWTQIATALPAVMNSLDMTPGANGTALDYYSAVLNNWATIMRVLQPALGTNTGSGGTATPQLDSATITQLAQTVLGLVGGSDGLNSLLDMLGLDTVTPPAGTGTVTPSTGTPGSNMVNCAVGMIWTGASCQPCGAGYYSKGGNATVCQICPAGSMSKEKAGACTSCAKGRYSKTAGSITCLSCKAGTSTQDKRGAKACVPCTPGMFSGVASATCSQCPPGKYAAGSGNAVCKLCPKGYYNKFYMASKCQPCAGAPAGSTKCAAKAG